MTVRGPMTRAVADALKVAQIAPRDGAAVALVKRYAALIDDAVRLADEAALIEPEDETMARRLRALQVQVDAEQVVSDLGPKLLAALTALGMTAAGRGARGGGQGGVAVAGKLDELRARREQRAGAN